MNGDCGLEIPLKESSEIAYRNKWLLPVWLVTILCGYKDKRKEHETAGFSTGNTPLFVSDSTLITDSLSSETQYET